MTSAQHVFLHDLSSSGILHAIEGSCSHYESVVGRISLAEPDRLDPCITRQPLVFHRIGAGDVAGGYGLRYSSVTTCEMQARDA